MGAAEQIAKERDVGTATVKRVATFAKDVDTLAEAEGAEMRRSILSGDAPLTRQDVRELAETAEERRRKGLTFRDAKEAEAWLNEQKAQNGNESGQK